MWGELESVARTVDADGLSRLGYPKRELVLAPSFYLNILAFIDTITRAELVQKSLVFR